MKNNVKQLYSIRLIIVLILIFLGYFLYDNYFSLKAKANQIVENIYIGEFYILLEDITSDVMVTEFVLTMDKKVTALSLMEMRPFVFDIPQSIIEYDLTKTLSNTSKITMVIDVSWEVWEEWYELCGIQLYSSYGDFLYKEKMKYKEKMNYKFDGSLKRITYVIDNIPEKRFFYRVETTSGVKRMQLIFYKIPDEGWKLVSITQKNI